MSPAQMMVYFAFRLAFIRYPDVRIRTRWSEQAQWLTLWARGDGPIGMVVRIPAEELVRASVDGTLEAFAGRYAREAVRDWERQTADAMLPGPTFETERVGVDDW